MGKVEIIRVIEGWKGNAILVKKHGGYAIVSSVNALFTGPETLAFPATAEGEVISWSEIAGGRGMSRAEVIAELEAME